MKQGFDYVGVTVVFYCHDGKRNLLLYKRSQNCRDEKGRWDCGGGAVKFGESFEQAVRREVKEEYPLNSFAILYNSFYALFQTLWQTCKRRIKAI